MPDDTSLAGEEALRRIRARYPGRRLESYQDPNGDEFNPLKMVKERLRWTEGVYAYREPEEQVQDFYRSYEEGYA